MALLKPGRRPLLTRATERSTLVSVAFHAFYLNDLKAYLFVAGLGSCGVVNTVNDLIVAVSHDLFDTFPYVSLDSTHSFPLG